MRMAREPEIGDNSGAADDRLRLLIERVGRLEEEKKGIADDVKDVYAEAKAVGYDTKVMKQIIRLRKMNPDDRREQQMILETYCNALGWDLICGYSRDGGGFPRGCRRPTFPVMPAGSGFSSVADTPQASPERWDYMSGTLFLDIESFSATPIKQGTHRYAEDAEILLVAYAVDDEPVVVLDTSDDWASAVAPLQALIDGARVCILHNSAFDRTVLRHRGVTIPLEKIEDTMVLALQHSLPASLGALCEVLNVPQDKAKDKDGKKLIQLFSKPRPKNVKLRRATRETHPDEWQRFIEYARLDVDATRHVYRRLPRWNDSDRERNLWRLDQRANDIGVAGDIELARSALRAFERASRSLAARAGVLTKGAVASATQRGAFLQHLQNEYGLEADDMTGATVDRLLRDDLAPDLRELLEIRKQAAATSPAKYRTFIGAVSSDGRLRGSIQFCGAARTGRDAGRLVQLQNLPRSSMPYDKIELGIAAMKADCEDLLFDNVSELCASAVRGLLVASPGHKFAVADLANIEGRMAAWLAGEDWKLKAFKAYDAGDGHDLYVVAYARSFGVPPEVVLDNKKNGDGSMRQIGKVQELSLQYQGGEGAFRKMAGRLAETLSSEAVQEIVQAWRRAHPRIKGMWYELENAARSALERPGESFEVRGVLRFDSLTDAFGVSWLRMRLPSGRYLCYCRPRIDRTGCGRCGASGRVPFEHNGSTIEMVCPECNGNKYVGSGKLTYEGVNQFTRKWEPIDTYGGKFFEQACQAASRDVFMGTFLRAAAEGYPARLRVHDELVCEVPDTDEYSAETLAEIMAQPVSWAIGLPLAAEGFECKRYRK